MTPEERIVMLSENIENISGELLESLDTLNYHSLGEAVRDMRKGVFHVAGKMQHEVLTLLKALTTHGFLKMESLNKAAVDDLNEAGAMLDILRKVSAETKSYSHFLEELPSLLRILEKWSLEGLQPVEGLAYHEAE